MAVNWRLGRRHIHTQYQYTSVSRSPETYSPFKPVAAFSVSALLRCPRPLPAARMRPARRLVWLHKAATAVPYSVSECHPSSSATGAPIQRARSAPQRTRCRFPAADLSSDRAAPIHVWYSVRYATNVAASASSSAPGEVVVVEG